MKIIKNLPMNEYQAAEGVSNSMLSNIEINPSFYKYCLQEPKKQTDALTFGSLLHCLILQPDNFDNEFAIEPIVNKRTNEGKELLEQFNLDNKNKIIVNNEQLQLADFLRQKVYEHPKAKALLTGAGDNEISLFWQDSETGVMCKARFDRAKYVGNKFIIIDVKSVRSAKPENFTKTVYDLKYHNQASWYIQCGNACFKDKEFAGFVFIAVEKEPPYSVAVYEMTELYLKIGEINTRKNLLTYKECKEKDNWWNYDGEKAVIHTLDPPQWVLNKYLEDLDLEEKNND